MRAVVARLPNVHRTVLLGELTVGSRYEPQRLNGISHFLEHMIYRGTPTHPTAHKQALAFESLGGTLVAATAVDTGTMAIGVPPENLSRVIPLFREVYAEPVFNGIEVERGIVREEILEGVDDAGLNIDCDNLIRELVFHGHPLGMPITGTLEHLDRYDESSLKAHHDAFYVGCNTVLTVAGPVDPERVLAQLETEFSSVASGSEPVVSAPGNPPESQFRYVAHRASQTMIRLGFRAPSWHDPQDPAMEVLMRVLDDGMSTRLYRHICDERGLCYDVSGHYETYADSGLVELAAEAAHDRAIDVVTELIRVVSELREHGPTSDELDRVRTRHRWQMDQMLDDAESVAEFFASEAQMGRLREPLERHDEVAAVTADAVRESAARVFRGSVASLVAVGKLDAGSRDSLSRLVARL